LVCLTSSRPFRFFVLLEISRFAYNVVPLWFCHGFFFFIPAFFSLQLFAFGFPFSFFLPCTVIRLNLLAITYDGLDSDKIICILRPTSLHPSSFLPSLFPGWSLMALTRFPRLVSFFEGSARATCSFPLPDLLTRRFCNFLFIHFWPVDYCPASFCDMDRFFPNPFPFSEGAPRSEVSTSLPLFSEKPLWTCVTGVEQFPFFDPFF